MALDPKLDEALRQWLMLTQEQAKRREALSLHEDSIRTLSVAIAACEYNLRELAGLGRMAREKYYRAGERLFRLTWVDSQQAANVQVITPES